MIGTVKSNATPSDTALATIPVRVAAHESESGRNGCALRFRSDEETELSLRRRAAPRAADIRCRVDWPRA